MQFDTSAHVRSSRNTEIANIYRLKCCVQHRLWSAFCVFVFICIASVLCVFLNVAARCKYSKRLCYFFFFAFLFCASLYFPDWKWFFLLSHFAWPLILHFCYYVLHSKFGIHGLNMLNANAIVCWIGIISVLVAGCPVKCGERIFYLNNVSDFKIERSPVIRHKK